MENLPKNIEMWACTKSFLDAKGKYSGQYFPGGILLYNKIDLEKARSAESFTILDQKRLKLQGKGQKKP